MTLFKSNIEKENQLVKTESTINEVDSINVNYKWFFLAAIILVTLIVYSPVYKNNFLNWDDDTFVSNNPDIRNLKFDNLKTFFTRNYVENYLPFTMISFAIDYQIDGLNPKIFVLTNLLFHILNALLVFLFVLLLIRSFTNSKFGSIQKANNPFLISAISSILFAIHPINVESVAWISERKNVLYVFFFLLSIISYVKYLKSAKFKFYNISLLLFLCSLLSKGVAVSLPLSIIAIDYLFLRKMLSKKVLIEKIPFFLLAMIFGFIALIGQGKEIVKIDNSLYEHLAFASFSFINYLFKLILPINLSAYYFCPNKATLLQWFCFIILLIIFLLSVRYRKRISPSRLSVFAFCFYLANIVFLIQLIPLGNVLMADRYIYLSSIGFFLLVAMFIVQLAGKFSIVYLFLGISLVLLGFKTHERIKVWNNSMVFWSDLIEKNNNLPFAWFSRGLYKESQGDNEGAMNDFNMAIQLHPNYKEVYYEKSNIFLRMGKKQLAMDNILKAIFIDPKFYDAYLLRGNLKNETGDYQGAIEDFSKVIQLKPDYAIAFFNRGNILREKGDLKSAMDDYSKTINIQPDYVGAYTNRGNIKLGTGDFNGAITDYEKAIYLNPKLKEAQNGKGISNVFLRKYQEALTDFSKAIGVDPKYADAYFNRGRLLKIMKRYNEALSDLNKAVQLDSANMKVILIRAKVNLKLKNYDKAITDCNNVLEKNSKMKDAIITRAASYYLKERFNEALNDLDNVIGQNTDIGAAYYLRGMTYIKLRNKLKGENDLVRAKNLRFVPSESDYDLNNK
jgi:protein O-mannosyl-transferase